MADSTEHVVLVAFTVNATDWQTAQQRLMEHLPRPDGDIESWWIAEDVRFDGSDNDSAVFVHPGAQREGHNLLATWALSAGYNLPINAPAEDQ